MMHIYEPINLLLDRIMSTFTLRRNMHVSMTSGMYGLVRSLIVTFLLIATASVGSAADFNKVSTQFTIANTSNVPPSTATMLNQVGNVVNSVAQIITGPVLYVVMGVAIMIAVYGFVQGKMMMAFMGIGGFILAGALKALFGTFTG